MTDKPKLSLSRMESQLAKVSRESTTVQKDEWEQLLSWAKRAMSLIDHWQEFAAGLRTDAPDMESNALREEFGE